MKVIGHNVAIRIPRRKDTFVHPISEAFHFSTRLDSHVKSDTARVQSYLHLSMSRQRYSAAPRDLWSHSARSIHFARNRLEPRGRSSRTGNGVNFHGPGKFINPSCILPSGWNPVTSRRNPPSTWSCFLARLPFATLSSVPSLRRVSLVAAAIFHASSDGIREVDLALSHAEASRACKSKNAPRMSVIYYLI